MIAEFINRIDERLLALCTLVSHRLQRNVGLTNFFIAKLGATASAISLMVGIVNYFHKILARSSNVFIFLIECMLLLSFAFKSWACTEAESDLSETRAVNPLLRSTIKDRLLWIIASVISCAMFFLPPVEGFLDFCNGPLFPLGIVVFYCFVAVVPLPPGKSRVRQWFESFGKVLVPARERV